MSTIKLKRKQWHKIRNFIDEHPNAYVANSRACKRFIEGVLWIMRSGSQWRLLPKKYGNWNSVYKRFNGWSERGVWQEMFENFADDPEMKNVMMDSSVVRAHACSAGAVHKKGDKRLKHSATAEAGSAAKFT